MLIFLVEWEEQVQVQLQSFTVRSPLVKYPQNILICVHIVFILLISIAQKKIKHFTAIKNFPDIAATSLFHWFIIVESLLNSLRTPL